MLNKLQQARANLAAARRLREAGRSYRQIRRELGLTPAQIGRIKRELGREKGALTRLRQRRPDVEPRDYSVNASSLPPTLRRLLVAAGYRTLGDLADRLSDPDAARLETIAGIGPTKADMIRDLLDRHALLAGSDDLQSKIEALFPEMKD